MSDILWMITLSIGVYIIVCVFWFIIDKFEDIKEFFSVWENGVCRERIARRNKYTCRVQFLVLDSFHNHHWYDFSYRHWRLFEPDKKRFNNKFIPDIPDAYRKHF